MNMSKIYIILLSLALISEAHSIEVAILEANMLIPAQIETLKTIFLDAFHTVYIKDWDAKIEQEQNYVFDNYICQFKTDPQMILFVAHKDDQLAGWALFKKIDEENAILEIICISPKFWRQGIGKKLVFAICDLYPSICHLSLITRKINPISPQFYETLGFKKTDFSLPEYQGFDSLQGFEWRKYEHSTN